MNFSYPQNTRAASARGNGRRHLRDGDQPSRHRLSLLPWPPFLFPPSPPFISRMRAVIYATLAAWLVLLRSCHACGVQPTAHPHRQPQERAPIYCTMRSRSSHSRFDLVKIIAGNATLHSRHPRTVRSRRIGDRFSSCKSPAVVDAMCLPCARRRGYQPLVEPPDCASSTLPLSARRIARYYSTDLSRGWTHAPPVSSSAASPPPPPRASTVRPRMRGWTRRSLCYRRECGAAASVDRCERPGR